LRRAAAQADMADSVGGNAERGDVLAVLAYLRRAR
jgi:hypothetical protein